MAVHMPIQALKVVFALPVLVIDSSSPADSLKPQDSSLAALGPPEVLTEDEFNSTAFEFLLNNAVPADFELGYLKNTSFFRRVDTIWRTTDYPLAGPIKPITGFALGVHPLSLEKYDNDTELVSAFEKAHRLLFSIAVSRTLQEQTPGNGPMGSVSSIHYGLVISRTFAAAVEGLLLLIATFGSFLLYLCRRSRSKLDSDPGSISALVDIVRSSRDTKSIFSDKDFTDESGLRQGLEAFRFLLSETANDSSPKLEVTATEREENVLISHVSVGKNALRGHYKPDKPLALQVGIGVLFVSIMALAIALLCYLRRTEIDQGVPPPLAIWQALKNQHYLLALLCSTSILANVLTVGLGGLFNERLVAVDQPTPFRQTYAPTISNHSFERFSNFMYKNSNAYQDHFFVTMANMSYGTPLPPWLTGEFFFPPLTREDEIDTTSDYFTVKTTGFGVLPSCSPLLSSDCTKIGSNTSAGVGYPVGECGEIFTMGWGRSTVSNGTSKAITNSTFLACEPVIISRFFDLVVDSEGHVLSAEMLDDTGETSNGDPDPASVRQLLRETNDMFQPSGARWHNDSITNDWMHYFLTVLNDDNTALVDPSEDVPDLQSLIPQVERVYKQTFAALLYTVPQVFEDYGKGGPVVMGKRMASETRLFMARGAFVISTLVLAINIIMATFIYWRGTAVYLPRMPTTIASILGYTASSHLASEGWKNPLDEKQAASSTFSFGYYLGVDGKAHLGIDVDPYVVPVDVKALERGDTRIPDSTIKKLQRYLRWQSHNDVWL
ncbi:hypothetical protein DL769_011028 [Monosporascus sp. CRB-8-3]|nr:hypothetical protein DL769_011028 [Monosporascus sp. CRB-8-3]